MENMNEIITEIHNSFDFASDRAIEAAREILNSSQINNEAEILERCGFASVSIVKANIEIKKTIKLAGEEAEVILYFQQHYPKYKYILERQVTEICEKYGLVCADVSRYKGEVPSKNIQEIGNFKVELSDNDKKYFKQYIRMSYDAMMGRVPADPPIEIDFVDYTDHMSYMMFDRRYEDDKFKICAPIKDMLLERSYQQGVHIYDIPDPIVLRPVRKGYLLVSKWGLEASDSSLTNEKMN